MGQRRRQAEAEHRRKRTAILATVILLGFAILAIVLGAIISSR